MWADYYYSSFIEMIITLILWRNILFVPFYGRERYSLRELHASFKFTQMARGKL